MKLRAVVLLACATAALALAVPAARADAIVAEPPLPVARAWSAAVWTGSEILTFGGSSSSARAGVYSTIQSVDPTTGIVTTESASLPDTIGAMSAVWDPVDRPATGCPGGCAFLFGGYGAATGAVERDEILRYNPTTGNLVEVGATIPEGSAAAAAVWDPRDLPATGCDDGCAYVLGGYAETVPPLTARIVRYNPATDTATVLGTLLPSPMTGGGVWDPRDRPGVCPGGCAYVFGAFGGLDRVARFNPDTASATATSAYFPYEWNSVAWDGSVAYVFGGTNTDNVTGTGFDSDRVWRYDPIADTTVKMSAAFDRSAAGVVWTGEDAWIVGGYRSGARADISSYDTEPGAPQNLAGAIGPGTLEASLSWQAPVWNTHTGPVTEYRVYRDGVLLATLGAVLSYADAGLAPGTTYAYTVTATTADGEGAASAAASVTTPNVPSLVRSLVATRGSADGEIALAWQAPASDGGRPVTAYTVYRDGAPAATLGATLAWTDTGLAEGTTHAYRVAASNDAGEGPASDPSSARTRGPPVAPGGLTVATGPGLGELSLSWSAPADDGGATVASYRVLRGTAAGSEAFLVDVGAALTHRDTGLGDGATRWYRVEAVNSYGTGDPAPSTSGTTYLRVAPAAPTSFDATPAIKKAQLTWAPPPDNGGPPVQGYKVHRNGSYYVTVGTAVRYNNTAVVGGVEYTYRIVAYNAASGGSVFTETRTVRPYTTELPAAPTLTVTPSPGRIDLSWTAASTGYGPPATSYRILRGTSAEALSLYRTVGDTLADADASVVSGTTYHYAVEAVSSAGTGARSSVASARVPTVPSAPTDLAVVPGPGVGQLGMTWGHPTDDGGSARTGYRLSTATTTRYRYDDGTPESVVGLDGDDGAQTKRIDLRPGAPSGARFWIYGKSLGCGPQLRLTVNTYLWKVTTPCAAWTTTGSWAVFDVPVDKLLASSANTFKVQITACGTSSDCAAIGVDGERDAGRSDVSTSYSYCAYTCVTVTTPYEGEMLAWLETDTVEPDQTLSPSATALTVSAATNVTKSFELRALNTVGESPPAGAVAATTFRAPGAPAASATAGPDPGKVALAWTAPTDDGGTPVVGYRILRGTSPTSLAQVADLGLVSSWTDAGRGTNATWTYRVEARNAVGAGYGSASRTATTFDLARPPASLAAIAGPGPGQVSVSWSGVTADGGSPVTGYRVTASYGESPAISRDDNGASSARVYLDSATARATKRLNVASTYVARAMEARLWVHGDASYCGASAAQTIRLTVNGQAIRDFDPCAVFGTSAKWVSFGVPPGLVATSNEFTLQKVAGTPTQRTLYVSVDTTRDFGRSDAIQGSGADVAGELLVYLDVTVASGWSTADVADPSHVFSGFPPSTTRTYRTAALTAVGSGWRSLAATATTFGYASVPTALETATGPSMGEIGLAWSAPATTGGTPLTGYRVYRGDGVVATLGDVTSFSDTGLAHGATYLYGVAALNAVGEGPRATASATTWVDTPPAAPPSLTATSGPRGGEVALAWSPPAENGGPPLTGYRIFRAADEGPLAAVADVDPDLAFQDSGLAPQATYRYAVAGLNMRGEGEPSSVASASTYEGALPAAPRELAVAPGPGNGEVTLDWLAPTANAGPPIESYRVYVGSAAGDLSPVGGTGARTFVATGLAADTRYWFAVAAVSAQGEGPLSDEATTYANTPPLREAYQGASSVWTGRYLYVLGGEDGFGALSQIVRYDPTNGQSLTMAATLPTPRAYGGAAWDGRYAWYFGGTDGFTTTDEIVRYDPQADQATVHATRLPSARSHFSTAWGQDKAWLFGGLDDDLAPLGGVLRFDPATGALVVPLGGDSFPASYDHAVVWVGNAGYVLGGCYAGDCPSDRVARYTHTTSSAEMFYEWDNIHEPLVGVAAVWDGTNILYAGGRNDLGGTTRHVVKFQLSGTATDLTADLPGPRGWASAQWDGARMLIAGGTGCSGPCTGVVPWRPIPSAPTLAAHSYVPGRVALWWTGSNGNSYSQLTGYRVYEVLPNGTEVLVASTTSTGSAVMTTAPASTGLHTYRVRGLDHDVNLGLASNDASAVAADAVEPPVEAPPLPGDVPAPIGHSAVGAAGTVTNWRNSSSPCTGSGTIALAIDVDEGAAALQATSTCRIQPDDWAPGECSGLADGALECHWETATASARILLEADGRFRYTRTGTSEVVEWVGTLARSCVGQCGA
ncbi:MAG TPA: hypothetical protein VI997_02995 [Candidatus Thermoplasmatota archaeon]|nr:hypothetical protein [Candidatus Thermoplasmatota archaeon]